MALLILLPILFLFGLVNSYFLLRSKKSKPTSDVKIVEEKQTKMKTKNHSVDLETVFATFDSDGDGFITSKELKESLQRLGLSAGPEDIANMMERVDANGDGLIDIGEFRELHDSIWRDKEDGEGVGEDDIDLREAFHVFDANGDGLITVEELGSVLKTIGLKQGAVANDCRDMIREVDIDGDGMVNFEEFKNMMMVKDGKKIF